MLYTSFFNDAANSMRTSSHLFSAFVRTAFVGAFNAAAGVDYNFSKSKNRTTDFLSTNQYIAGLLNANITIGEKFSSKAEYNYYKIENAGNYSFLDATFKYKLIKDKLTLYLKATNLLDETSFQTITLDSFSEYQRKDALNPRYVMIGAKINIR